MALQLHAHPSSAYSTQRPSSIATGIETITDHDAIVPQDKNVTGCESEDVKSPMSGNDEDGFGKGSLLQRWMKMLNVETSDAVSREFCPSHITYYVK